jgi:sugar lactone lactonase YvrE
MQEFNTTVVAEGLAFPEGPRWRDGWLWFTDQHDATLYRMSTQGELQRYAATDTRPGGLGWLPDGSLLMVLMEARRIVRRVDDRWEPYADLSALASFHCNDMVVTRHGVVFAGNFGEEPVPGRALRPAELIRIDRDGNAEVVDRELVFPNGSVVTDDGRTLLVAETFANRITRFDLDDEDRVTGRQIWAELGDATPDGICLDAAGALWIASPTTHELLRVRHGGEVLARCTTRGAPYACMLGGDDRQTLYACTAETTDPGEAARIKSGRIEATRVDVPGAGLP